MNWLIFHWKFILYSPEPGLGHLVGWQGGCGTHRDPTLKFCRSYNRSLSPWGSDPAHPRPGEHPGKTSGITKPFYTATNKLGRELPAAQSVKYFLPKCKILMELLPVPEFHQRRRNWAAKGLALSVLAMASPSTIQAQEMRAWARNEVPTLDFPEDFPDFSRFSTLPFLLGKEPTFPLPAISSLVHPTNHNSFHYFEST